MERESHDQEKPEDRNESVRPSGNHEYESDLLPYYLEELEEPMSTISLSSLFKKLKSDPKSYSSEGDYQADLALKEESLAPYKFSRAKRFLDLVLSISSLLLLSPLFFLTSVLIKLDSRGPVFWRRELIGQDYRRGRRRYEPQRLQVEKRGRNRRREDYYGRPFTAFSFRTLQVAHGERTPQGYHLADNQFSFTRMGRIIKFFGLENLPQLWNVLKGEMSLVGPRPEDPHRVRAYAEGVKNYLIRFSTKPGLTGLSQVVLSKSNTKREPLLEAHLDSRYVQHWSLSQDLRILAKSLPSVPIGKWLYPA